MLVIFVKFDRKCQKNASLTTELFPYNHKFDDGSAALSGTRHGDPVQVNMKIAYSYSVLEALSG